MSGLTMDDIVQVKTGSFTGTSGSATLDVGTTAGNAIVILAGLGADGTNLYDLTVPSGFTEVIAMSGSGFEGGQFAFIKPSASASETSWTLTVTGFGAQQVAWAAFEMSNLDNGWPNKVYLNSPSLTSGAVTSKLAAITDISQTYSGLALAAFFGENSGGSTPTIDGYTDGFEEIATQTVSGTRGHRLSIAAKLQQAVEAVECTAAVSPSSFCSSWMLVFTGLDSHHVTDVTGCFGAEIGTGTNITTSTLLEPAVAPWDEVVGTPTIVSTSPRSGSCCLEFASTSAAENLVWAQRAAPAVGTLGQVTTSSLPTVVVERFHVYFPTSLPGVDVDIASCEVTTLANGMKIWYRTASQKIGIQIGSGTEVLSDATVAADTWIGVDYRYDPRTTTHVVDWALDYNAGTSDTTTAVAQTQVTTAGMTAGTITKIRKGHTAAVTVTYRMDDIVTSASPAANVSRKTYPIGDVRVVPLKVDPSGTPTVSGTSGNFRLMSANGTLATWTAAGTITALDDIPPTIGASSDGVVQITNATGDYVQVPMETFTCAPDFTPLAARWYWCGWAASGNPASLGWEAHDGTGGPSQRSSTDAEFDDTTLRWVTGLHRGNASIYYAMTQTKVDGLVFRLGFSSDVNPDAGVHAVLCELVVSKTQPVPVFGEPGGTPRVEQDVDPVSGGLTALRVYTDSTQAVTVRHYDAAGTPTTTSVPVSSSPYTIIVNAADVPAAPRLELQPD